MTGFIVVYARLEWAAAFSPCSEFSMALAILVFLDPFQHTFPLSEGNNIILSRWARERTTWSASPAHACGLPPSYGLALAQGAAQAG